MTFGYYSVMCGKVVTVYPDGQSVGNIYACTRKAGHKKPHRFTALIGQFSFTVKP